MALDDFEDRRALDLAFRDELGEDRRLQNAQPDIEADADQDEAQEERHAPAPGEELLARHLAEGEHREIGEEEPAGHAELRPGGDEAARMVGARPFHRHQNRTAPFAADPHAPDEAQDREDDGAPDADAL